MSRLGWSNHMHYIYRTLGYTAFIQHFIVSFDPHLEEACLFCLHMVLATYTQENLRGPALEASFLFDTVFASNFTAPDVSLETGSCCSARA